MKQKNEKNIILLNQKELIDLSGGHPIVVVLGAITAGISMAAALDKAGEWFLEGWNNPQ